MRSAGENPGAHPFSAGEQLGRIGVHPVGASSLKLLPAVSFWQKPDAERAGPASDEQVPRPRAHGCVLAEHGARSYAGMRWRAPSVPGADVSYDWLAHSELRSWMAGCRPRALSLARHSGLPDLKRADKPPASPSAVL